MDREQKVRIGEWFFRYRDYTPIPLIILLLIIGDPSVFSSTLGLLVIVIGELFRIYSVGFIGTVSRTRSESTGQRLVVRGPFAYVRNPLYVGNFFISMGFAIFAASPILIGLTALLFAVQYYFIVRYEETILTQKFGDDYEKYCRQVPAWFPSELPSLNKLDWPKEFSSALKSEKRTLTTIFALLALLVVFS
ncbi:MAG: methyltransferase family protein [Oligoflexus sp.]